MHLFIYYFLGGYIPMEQEQRPYKIPKYADEYIEAGIGLDYDDSNGQYEVHQPELNHLETQQQHLLEHDLIKGEVPQEDDDDTIINVDDDLNLNSLKK